MSDMADGNNFSLIKECGESSTVNIGGKAQLSTHVGHTDSRVQVFQNLFMKPASVADAESANKNKEGASVDEQSSLLEQFLQAKEERIKKLEGELGRCIKEFNYEMKPQILKKLDDLRQKDDIETAIELAEYDLLHNNEEASIGKLREWIYTSGSRSALDVKKLGNELQKQNRYTRVMILYKIAYDLQSKEEKFPPDLQLRYICAQVRDIQSAIKQLIKDGGRSRDIAKEYGLKFSKGMLEDLRAVMNASPDVKIPCHCTSVFLIIEIYNQLGEHKKGIQLINEALTMMKQHFGDNASNYKDYGGLLNVLGVTYQLSHQWEQAEQYMITGIEALKKALDYKNEKERQYEIDVVNEGLKRLHILKELYGPGVSRPGPPPPLFEMSGSAKVGTESRPAESQLFRNVQK